MKKHVLPRFLCLMIAVCANTANMSAMEIEATLKPQHTIPSAERPFTANGLSLPRLKKWALCSTVASNFLTTLP